VLRATLVIAVVGVAASAAIFESARTTVETWMPVVSLAVTVPALVTALAVL
jgi:hypothetical protein